MSLICGKSLWNVVCGSCVLPSDEVVGEELEHASDHLQKGILFYEPYSQSDHDAWIKKVKLKDNQKSFVMRVGKMLNMSSSQSWNLFLLFLQQEYKGCSKELMSALSSHRSESKLMHQIYYFYLTDKLHMLSCRTHLLASASKKHPYQSLFRTFIKDILDKDQCLGVTFVKELLAVNQCINNHCDKQFDDSFFGQKKEGNETHKALMFAASNPDLPEDAEFQWLCASLAIAKHLLASLLVYYASPNKTCPPEDVMSLLELAQDGGVCGSAKSLMSNSTQGAAVSSLVQDIDALHSLLLVLVINPEADTKTHILCEQSWRDRLDPMFMNLGSRPFQLPALLAWSLVQGRHAIAEMSSGGSVASSIGTSNPMAVHQYSKMAQRSMQAGVMKYLMGTITIEAITTDSLLKELSCSVIYALVCVIGAQINLESLSSVIQVEDMKQLVQSCLASNIPAQLFWGEEAGGAGLMLPHALSLFPHSPGPLLSLCKALAEANEDSCTKVIELLSEIPSSTWAVEASVLRSLCHEVGGGQVITHRPIHPLMGYTVDQRTSGTIISNEGSQYLVKWHGQTNVWQIVLSAVCTLESEISNGLSVSGWLLYLVEHSLHLLATIIQSSTKHTLLLDHIIEAVLELVLKLSSVLEPRISLVTALVKVLAAVAKADASRVWKRLDKCSLFPSLPKQTTVKENTSQYYRCGELRRIVCGKEAVDGKYPCLTSFCQLLSHSVRSGELGASVRGGVVFLVREVLPSLIVQWNYCSAMQRVEVLHDVMEVLHRMMEPEKTHQDITEEVGVQLCSSECGGSAIRSVLEAGASLEASLDTPPAQWPHASHATTLAHTAHLALSILHRLVLRYCTDGSEMIHKQKLRELIAGDRKQKGSSLGGSMVVRAGLPHLALTIAQYIHHRLNPRLPYLALRTLTKLAQRLEVPLVACLGAEAEVIRELLLTRLEAATEDTRVKVAICQLLTAAVGSQPGLLRAFLSPPDDLMNTLTDLLTTHCSNFSSINSVELVSSAVELIASLWESKHVAAMECLRKSPDFWCVMVDTLLKENVPINVLINSLNLLANEYYVAKSDHAAKLADGLEDAMKSFFENAKFASLCNRVMDVCSDEDKLDEEMIKLIRTWRNLMNVMLAAYTDRLSKDNLKVLVKSTLRAINACLTHPEDETFRKSVHLLSDTLLSFTTFSSCEVTGFWSDAGNVLESMRATVMQTPAPTQLRVLSGVLRAVERVPPYEKTHGTQPLTQSLTNILSSVLAITEQHCSISNSGNEFATNNCTLQVSCSLLHVCLMRLPPHAINSLMRQAHVVNALLHAATLLVQDSSVPQTPFGSSEEVACTILSLLAYLAKMEVASSLLTTQNLSTSLTLSLSSSQQQTVSAPILSNILWVSINSLERQGVGGVDGCISVAALHLTSLVDALSRPNQLPDLALAAASLTASLAPYRRLWIATQMHSYGALVESVAVCVHTTTHLIRLRGSMLQPSKTPMVNPTDKKETLSPQSINLVNKLLKVLLSCLHALRLLGPDMVEVLCTTSLDVMEWLPPLVQPSFRKSTSAEPCQPNLGTLTSLLDLVTSDLLVESRNKADKDPTKVSISHKLLKEVGEEALCVLLIQSSLALLNPDCSSRDVRDLKMLLSDDMSSFFSQWLGIKRLSSLASPMPMVSPMLSSTSNKAPTFPPGSTMLDIRFLRLAKHLVVSLCHS